MFNKRDQHEPQADSRQSAQSEAPAAAARAPAPGTPPQRSSGAATIGPSISIDGTLKGEEDLVVEGRIKGTVSLKNNTLTVGAQGKLEAEVFAHTILVDGTVNGDLYASESISIRKSARISGNILAPRISLDDGAKFRGSIDMDAESEAFRKAFGSSSAKPVRSAPESKTTAPKSDAETSSSAGSQKPQPGKVGGSAA